MRVLALSQQSYASTLPSTLLSANVRPSREPEHQYSPFALKAAMATKYHNRPLGPALSEVQMSPRCITPLSMLSTSPVVLFRPHRCWKDKVSRYQLHQCHEYILKNIDCDVQVKMVKFSGSLTLC